MIEKNSQKDSFISFVAKHYYQGYPRDQIQEIYRRAKVFGVNSLELISHLNGHEFTGTQNFLSFLQNNFLSSRQQEELNDLLGYLTKNINISQMNFRRLMHMIQRGDFLQLKQLMKIFKLEKQAGQIMKVKMNSVFRLTAQKKDRLNQAENQSGYYSHHHKCIKYLISKFKQNIDFQTFTPNIFEINMEARKFFEINMEARKFKKKNKLNKSFHIVIVSDFVIKGLYFNGKNYEPKHSKLNQFNISYQTLDSVSFVDLNAEILLSNEIFNENYMRQSKDYSKEGKNFIFKRHFKPKYVQFYNTHLVYLQIISEEINHTQINQTKLYALLNYIKYYSSQTLISQSKRQSRAEIINRDDIQYSKLLFLIKNQLKQIKIDEIGILSSLQWQNSQISIYYFSFFYSLFIQVVNPVYQTQIIQFLSTSVKFDLEMIENGFEKIKPAYFSQFLHQDFRFTYFYMRVMLNNGIIMNNIENEKEIEEIIRRYQKYCKSLKTNNHVDYFYFLDLAIFLKNKNYSYIEKYRQQYRKFLSITTLQMYNWINSNIFITHINYVELLFQNVQWIIQMCDLEKEEAIQSRIMQQNEEASHQLLEVKKWKSISVFLQKNQKPLTNIIQAISALEIMENQQMKIILDNNFGQLINYLQSWKLDTSPAIIQLIKFIKTVINSLSILQVGNHFEEMGQILTNFCNGAINWGEVSNFYNQYEISLILMGQPVNQEFFQYFCKLALCQRSFKSQFLIKLLHLKYKFGRCSLKSSKLGVQKLYYTEHQQDKFSINENLLFQLITEYLAIHEDKQKNEIINNFTFKIFDKQCNFIKPLYFFKEELHFQTHYSVSHHKSIITILDEIFLQINKFAFGQEDKVGQLHKLMQFFNNFDQYSKVFMSINKRKVTPSLMCQIYQSTLNQQQQEKQKLNDKIAIIKSFEKVVFFYHDLSKTQKLKDVFIKICNFERSDIEKCAKMLKYLQLKIEQALNSQNFFKIQIQNMLINSTFHSNKSGDDQIQIFIEYQTNQSSENVQNNKGKIKISKLNLKKLQEYYDYAKIAIDQIGNQVANQVEQNTKFYMKIYTQMFNIVNKIFKRINKLLKYGCNYQYLQRELVITSQNAKITENSLNQLRKFSTTIKTIEHDWTSNVDKINLHYPYLTNFVGTNLRQIINDLCRQDSKCSSLGHLYKITQQKYSEIVQQYKSHYNQLIEAQSQYKTVAFIDFNYLAKIFKLIQEKNQKSSQISKVQNRPSPKISMITSQKQNFYLYIHQYRKSRQQAINNIFFCHSEIVEEELTFFISRAISDNKGKYLIVGVSDLLDQLQIKFCQILEKLVTSHKNLPFTLIFIDCSENTLVYKNIMSKKKFNASKQQVIRRSQIYQQRNKQLNQLMENVWIVSSKYPGLGKTYFIEKQSFQQNKKLIRFPIYGHISFKNLMKRLKQLCLTNNSVLLIQIGYVENKQKLDIFLAEFVLFKYFYYREYYHCPANVKVYIELQNIAKLDYFENIPIIKLLMNNNRQKGMQPFILQKLVLDKNNKGYIFVLSYLSKLYDKSINKQHVIYSDFVKIQQTLYPPNSLDLIKHYFLKWFLQNKRVPTYSKFHYLMKILLQSFITFSNNNFIIGLSLQENESQNESQRDKRFFERIQLNQFKERFLNIIIQNTLQNLETCINIESQEMNNVDLSLAFQLKQIPLLIIQSFNNQKYNFVFHDHTKVPRSIQSLILSQNKQTHNKLLKITNVNSISKIFLQHWRNSKQMLSINEVLYQISGNNQFTQENTEYLYEQYKMTYDNLLKICFIVYRIRSCVPCILMGQSGVGKTSLINFLVHRIFKEKLLIYNVHAGVMEQQLNSWIQEIVEAAQKQLTSTKKRVWVFFDEFNTTDYVSYFKEIMIDQRFNDRKLPQNIIFIAACNPLRRKQTLVQLENIADNNANKNVQQQMAFKVKPIPQSIMQILWDYRFIQEEQLGIYAKKMLQSIKYENMEKLILNLVQIHKYFKEKVEISFVSLRDIARYEQIFHWFLKYLDLQQKAQNILVNTQKAVILSLMFCYVLKICDKEQKQKFILQIQSRMNFKRKMIDVWNQQQKSYVEKLQIQQQNVALNRPLLQNIFISLVSILNKIPVLLIGNPGNSKTLSTKIIIQKFKGSKSILQFCKKFNKIRPSYFQGSPSCTSAGIEYVIYKVLSNISQDQLNLIVFDQIGLAQLSPHNPLKVLHSHLQMTKKRKFSFIGISNYALDLAKMSRFLILYRQDLEENEIIQTCLSIYKSYFGDNKTYADYFRMIGSYYYHFYTTWNSKQNQLQGRRIGFFGLRDFYYLTNQVCLEIKNQLSKKEEVQIPEIMKIILRGICMNFDGQKDSLLEFSKIIKKVNEKYGYKEQLVLQKLNLQEIIRMNNMSKKPRYLMFFINGDSCLQYISQLKFQNSKKIVSQYGSSFDKDKISQSFNLRTTAKIIRQMYKGNLVVFKDLNSNVQTTFYELFNKSYHQINKKKYVRLNVGANSMGKSYVDNNFDLIMFMQKSQRHKLDLPFLNRFQKHIIEPKELLDDKQLQMLLILSNWLKEIKQIIPKYDHLKLKSFLLNNNEEMLITMILKHKQKQSQDIQKIKKQLLKNSTYDFLFIIDNILLQSKQNNQRRKFIQKIKALLMNEQEKIKQIIQTPQHDKIIYTYDTLEITQSTKCFLYYDMATLTVIKIGLIKRQLQLRQQIEKFLNDKQKQKLIIKINFQKQFKHINFILFTAKQLKNLQYLAKDKKKQIIVLIQMNRYTLYRMKTEITVSYLHKYQHYFIENIQQIKGFDKIGKRITLKEIYQILNGNQYFIDYFYDAIKILDLKSPSNNQQLTSYYYQKLIKLKENQQFFNQTKSLIFNNLQKKKINYDLFFKNIQIFTKCNNFCSAILKYVGSFVSWIIQECLSVIAIQSFFLLLKEQQSNIEHYQEKFDESAYFDVKEEKYDFITKINAIKSKLSDNQQYQRFLKQNFIKYYKQQCKNISIQLSKVKDEEILREKAPNSRLIHLKQIVIILPAASMDYDLVFTQHSIKNIESTVQKQKFNYQSIKQTDFDKRREKFNKLLGQLEILCNNHHIITKSSNESGMNQSDKAILSQIYFENLLIYYLNRQNKRNISPFKLIEIIFDHFKPSQILKKLILLTISKEQMNFIIDLLQIAIRCKGQKGFQQFIYNLADLGKQIKNGIESQNYVRIIYSILKQCLQKYQLILMKNEQNRDFQDQQLVAKYCLEVKQLAIKVKQIRKYFISKKDSIEECYRLQLNSNLVISLDFFLRLCQKVNKSNIIKDILMKSKTQRINYIFLLQKTKQMLQQESNEENKNTICLFLANQLFYYWSYELLKSKYRDKMEESQRFFIQLALLCNKYSFFCNNAEQILKISLANINQIPQKYKNETINVVLDEFKDPQNNLMFLDKLIKFDQNFTILLMNLTTKRLQKKIQRNFKKIIDFESIFSAFTKFFIQSLDNYSNIHKMAIICFLKSFVDIYYKYITDIDEKQPEKKQQKAKKKKQQKKGDKKNEQALMQINKFLKENKINTKISNHIKLYLIAKLISLKGQQNFSLNFIKVDRFQWIKQLHQNKQLYQKYKYFIPHSQYKQKLQAFPYLRYFKIGNQQPFNLKQFTKQHEKELKNHKLLHFMVQLPQQLQQAAHIVIILKTISQLIIKWSFKIDRGQSKKKILSNVELSNEDIKAFKSSWNFFYEKKIIDYEIHQSSQLQKFICDSNNMGNFYGPKVIQFVKKLASHYNSHMDSMFDDVVSKINPFQIKKNEKFLQINQKDIEVTIKSNITDSIQFQVEKKFISLSKIQTAFKNKLARDQLYGFQINQNMVRVIQYKAENIHFITHFRKYTRYQKRHLSREDQNYFKQKKQDVFDYISKVIFIYNHTCKDKHKILKKKLLLKEFKQNKSSEFKRINAEEPARFPQDIGIEHLQFIYEYVEQLILEEDIKQLLDPIYKSPLKVQEKQKINKFIRIIKYQSNNQKLQLPTLNDLKNALYRLAGRNLRFNKDNSELKVYDILVANRDYWPRDYDIILTTHLRKSIEQVQCSKIYEILQIFKEQNEQEARQQQQQQDQSQESSQSQNSSDHGQYY